MCLSTNYVFIYFVFDDNFAYFKVLQPLTFISSFLTSLGAFTIVSWPSIVITQTRVFYFVNDNALSLPAQRQSKLEIRSFLILSTEEKESHKSLATMRLLSFEHALNTL